jgi:hypothetical protein
MNDTRKSWEQGRNYPLAFLNRTSLARWAPIPLRLTVGYRLLQHGFARPSKGAEAFAIILQKVARVCDGAIYEAVRNG